MENWIPVWNSYSVEGTVIPTRSPVSRGLLGDHMEGRWPLAIRGLNDCLFEHVLKFLASDAKAVRQQTARSCMNRRTSSVDVMCNDVLDWTGWGTRFSHGRKVGQDGVILRVVL